MTQLLYPIAEVAKMFGVNKQRIYDLIKYGHIRPIKIGTLKVSKQELDRFCRDYAGKDLTNLDNVVEYSHNTQYSEDDDEEGVC